MKQRRQVGSLYVNGDTCYLKYRTGQSKDGTRVHKSIRLCEKNDVYTWWKKNGELKFGSAVKNLRDETMARLMEAMRQESSGLATQNDMTVADFWEKRYLPHCEEIVKLTGKPRMKPSTVRGYRQIWKQHLHKHFGNMTLSKYEPFMGTRFLRTLVGTQGKNTLKHIKALGSSIFGYAVAEEIIKLNPWREVKLSEDAIESKATQHYTLAEADDLISALVDHVDCQLILALSCFLAVRPNEIAGLRWEDFDDEWVHIRRGVVRGTVDVPKTPESVASLPLINQVRVPLELWRAKSGNRKSGWVFESRNGTPVDLHNLTARVIIPHVEGKEECARCDSKPNASGVAWKSLYSGRRGAITNAIEKSNGNFAVGQALARHKSGKTTLDVYKKAITPDAFKAGMKMLEAAGSKASE